MSLKSPIIFLSFLILPLSAQSQSFVAVSVEAENYGSKNSAWHITSSDQTPGVSPDPDGSHAGGASGRAYLEVLPDRRVTHADPLGPGVSFWSTPGPGPRVGYSVNVPEAGRYFVYAKAFSTGSEDNGVHVGLNGSFPSSGARMQWCTGKNQWTWSSAQRTNSNHCGVERTIYLDIPSAGQHTIVFSAREDGFELDKFILLKEKTGVNCRPNANDVISCGSGGSGTVVSGGTTTGGTTDGGTGGGDIATGTSVMGMYNNNRDLISLFYDFAPDRDDGHASAAARQLTRMLGIEPLVVTGATGDGNRSGYINGAVGLQNTIWGAGRHIDAMGNWRGSVVAVANEWEPVLDRGAKVLVAEGGQSDFTADVIRELASRGLNYNNSQVVVVQHSGWNESKSNQTDLNFVRNSTRYIKIADGNGANSTADLNQKSSAFVSAQRNGSFSRQWNAAFQFLNPENKLDFSDTVELLHILGIGLGQISSPNTFLNYVERANTLSARTGDSGGSVGGTGQSNVVTQVTVQTESGNQDVQNNIGAVVVYNNSLCTAVGDELGEARANYADQCSLPRDDCDPLSRGGWICSSQNIATGDADSLYTYQQDSTNGFSGTKDYTATSYFPVCRDGRSDSVGEGWGWQDDATCVVTASSANSGATKNWVSCLSADNTINRFGKNPDGSECIVTDETLEMQLAGNSIDTVVSTTTPVYTTPEETDTIEDLDGAYADVEEETLPDTPPALENDGMEDLEEQREREVAISSEVSPRKTVWSDSYSVNGQCYCDSNFDHGLRGVSVQTPDGQKTVPQICSDIQAKYGIGSIRNRTYFNTAQCGHGPANTAPDERVCPGVPIAAGNYTGPNCGLTGARWNLDLLYGNSNPIVQVQSGGSWWQPKASDNLTWQIQLQGDVVLKPGVDVYAVDYTASQASINAAKATGAKLMCYISAGSAENWRSDFGQFPAAVVGNAYENWPGEWWLDTRNIEALAPIMRARMDACKSKGFDVIDPDNVNGYENPTGFNITKRQSLDYIRWLANESHARGMAFSLKNSESLVEQLVDAVDMMQSESCFRYGNCENARKLSAANKPVFAVEYGEVLGVDRFRSEACEVARQYNFSMIWRDILLTPNGPYETCG